jgi:uncharacterized protein YjbI with pentapeptide repeats
MAANIDAAILWRAQLQGADLSGAHLEDVNLSAAYFDGSTFLEAQIEMVVEGRNIVLGKVTCHIPKGPGKSSMP